MTLTAKGLQPLTRVDPSLAGEYLDSFYASLSAAVTAIGATVATLRISTANFPNGSTTTVPATLTLEFVGNGSILMDTGETVTINSDTANWPIRKIFYNAQAGQGTIKLLGRITDIGYMEWWGASPSASAATNTPVIQAALASMCLNGTNGSGLWIYNRTVKFLGMYEINDELDIYSMIGFRWEGQNKFNSGIRQTATNKRIIDGQSVSYGIFSNMIFQGGAASNIALVDLDYDGATTPGDLRPQNITFQDCVIQNNAFSGNFGTGHIGVHIAKSGSGAQGDNIRFYNCYANGFMEAGVQLGTSAQEAQNAVHVEWIGGDIQGCPKYGLAAYGGSFIVQHPTFENGNVTTADGVSQTGFDLYSKNSQNVNVVEDARSESLRFASGNWSIKNCSVSGPVTTFTTQWPSIPGTTSFVNQLVTGSAYGGDGKFYLVSNVATFGGLGTTTATGGSLTTVVKTSAGWTVNAWAGQRVTIMSGAGKYQYGVITSNTSDTLTCSAGFVSDYLLRGDTGLPVIITAPGATSTFVIEPDWATNPTSSGTVNFTALDVYALDGRPAGSSDAGLAGFTGSVDGFIATYGLKLRTSAASLKDVFLTVKDWHVSNTLLLDFAYPLLYLDNIRVARYGSGSDEYVAWTIARNGGSPTFRDYSHKQVGRQWQIGSAGDHGGGTGWIDVGWGRGDGTAYWDADAVSRNVMGFLGTLGRKTPAGTDQAGLHTDVQGGLPTGSGIPGDVRLWVPGTIGAAGTTIRSGQVVAGVSGRNGIFWSFKGANVASAAAIVPTGNVFHVTGTTTITSITSTGITAGTVITIIFDDVLTFTDGSNLKLAGNFVTTADDTITLVFDGTNFYERCRSVN